MSWYLRGMDILDGSTVLTTNRIWILWKRVADTVMLTEDIERHNKFQAMLGAEVQKIHLQDVDLKNYAKHVLNTGNNQEKRDVLAHLKDRLLLKDRKIFLE